jgi:hypothetical protein
MKANRRSFLGLLGVGAASAPLAAKAVADTEIAKLAGISTNGFGAGIAGVGGVMPDVDAYDVTRHVSYEKRIVGAADYVKMFGVPKVIEDNFRLNAKYVHGLDIDIACKRSWSMSVKVMTQQQRNYERQIADITKQGVKQRGLKMIKDVLGFDWPW